MYGMNGVQKREKCVHFKHLVVHIRRYITMKFKITKSPGKLPFYTMLLFTLLLLLLLLLLLVFGAFAQSRNAPLLFFVVFCFVCFRSRSHPVPHRGERVKQGTVHPRSIAIITSQNFL